ncbi:MAG: hypothetical protein NTV07_02675, partial [Candidatus Omnitrophica bacterium]|nr:hypothetical protein [Candidatus Omnitrophota bacterium]
LPSLQRRLFMDFVFGAKLAELSDKYGMSQVTVRGEIADLRRQAKAHILKKELAFEERLKRAAAMLAPEPKPKTITRSLTDLRVNSGRIHSCAPR